MQDDLDIPRDHRNFALLAALKTAWYVLETGPRFDVPELGSDSYAIGTTCRRVFLAGLEEARAEAGHMN